MMLRRRGTPLYQRGCQSLLARSVTGSGWRILLYSYRNIPATIRAVGSFVPERRLANSEIPGATAGAIKRLLGADERRVADPDDYCSDILAKAGKRVLEEAGTSPEDVDRLIISATPGDHLEPCTAAPTQHKLGLSCPAVDVGMSCVGWIAGMDHALRCLATGDRRVMVLAATVVSKDMGTSWSPMHRAIFGDGAAGVLLDGEGQDSHFIAGALHTWGDHHELIRMAHQGSHPADGTPPSFYMGDAAEIHRQHRRLLKPAVEEFLEFAGTNLDEVDAVCMHQVNKPLFDDAIDLLEMPRHKVIENYELYGNTISAELPISLADGVAAGRINRGDLVLLITFGAGFSGGGLLFRY